MIMAGPDDRGGQPDPYPGAVAGPGFERRLAAVGHGDRLHNGQAKPAAAPGVGLVALTVGAPAAVTVGVPAAVTVGRPAAAGT